MRFLYLALGIGIGYCGSNVVRDHFTNDMHAIAPPDNDPAKMCKIVTHSNSDGYKFWSCEKNEK